MRMISRNIIFSGAVVGLLTGVFYSLIVTPVYKAESSFRIGSVGMPIYEMFEWKDNSGRRLLENKSTLRQILYTRYRIREGRLNELEPPFLFSASSVEDSDIIKLSARGRTPKEAEEFLMLVSKWVIERHEKKYEVATNQLHNHSQFIKKIFVETNVLSAINQSKVFDVVGNKSKDTMSTEGGQGSSRFMLRTVAQSQLATLNLNTYPTEIVAMPTSSGQKIEPKTLLYTLTGLVFGIVAAVSAIGIYKEVQVHHS